MMLLALAAITLAGVVDMHVHCDPDSLPRSLDAIEVARLAKARGMRAVVLKNHFESTAGLAYLTRKQVPGIEVFGGIDLNGTVGGINPAAVEQMVKVKGGHGRVVWLPTFDAEHDTLAAEHPRPRVPVAGKTALLPTVKQIILLAAKHNLTLATGHSSPEESLLIVEEARQQRVQHVVVTHAMLCGMTVPQMKQAAAAGAYIEFVYNALTGPGRRFQPSDYAASIRAIGVDRVILASDLGQASNPPAPDGLLTFLKLMETEGFSAADIRRMSAANPAAALGLSPTY